MENKVELVLSVFIFLSIIFSIWSLQINKLKKNVKNEKEKLVKMQYPDLTVTDKKYREACIREYYQHYFIKFPRSYNFIFVMTVVVIGIIIGCYFSSNIVGACVSLAIYIFLSSLLQFLKPSIEKQQVFWENYLEKHPDNPLKVILFPMEKNIRLAKQLKLRALCSILLVAYLLFMAGVLFSYYYPPFSNYFH